jgi:hypothetical protein
MKRKRKRKMTKHEAILEKIKQDIKYYGRLIFLSLIFFIGIIMGKYLDFNTNLVFICASFLFGCLMVIVLLVDALNGDEEKGGESEI